MTFVSIAKIKVKNRIRTDVGDLDKFSKNIEEIGLIHPIVIDDNFNLIAGSRRLAACKKIGMDKVEVRIHNTDQPLFVELFENSMRKDFTIAEIVRIKSIIEKTRFTHRPKKSDSSNRIFEPGKRTVDIMSDILGESRTNIQKKLDLYKAAQKNTSLYDHIIKKIDDGQMGVSTAHRMLSKKPRKKSTIILPNGVWSICLMNPPIENSKHKTSNSIYETMSVKELISGIYYGQDIRKKFAKNAILYMWLPPEKMNLADMIFSGLGFEYCSNMIWDTRTPQQGSRQINYHEHLCYGIKGNMPEPAVPPKSIYREITSDIVTYEKPVIFYDVIEESYPEKEYLEIFGSKQYNENWTILDYNVLMMQNLSVTNLDMYIKQAADQLKKQNLMINIEMVHDEAAQILEDIGDSSKDRSKLVVEHVFKNHGVVINI